jgi:hypothetical protein
MLTFDAAGCAVRVAAEVKDLDVISLLGLKQMPRTYAGLHSW